MSDGPSNTDARGASSNVSPSHSTVPPPASGRIITSVPPVASSARWLSSSSITCKEDSVHPADSGVMSTVCGSVALRAGM